MSTPATKLPNFSPHACPLLHLQMVRVNSLPQQDKAHFANTRFTCAPFKGDRHYRSAMTHNYKPVGYLFCLLALTGSLRIKRLYFSISECPQLNPSSKITLVNYVELSKPI